MGRNLLDEAGIDWRGEQDAQVSAVAGGGKNLLDEAGIDWRNSGQFQSSDYRAPHQAMIDALKRYPGKAAEFGIEGLKSLFTIPAAGLSQPIEAHKHGLYGVAQGMRNLTENAPGNALGYIQEYQNREGGKRREQEKNQNWFAPHLRELFGMPTSSTESPIPNSWLDKAKGALAVSPEWSQKSQRALDTLKPESTGHGLEMIQGIGKFLPSALAAGGNIPTASILHNIGENRNILEDLGPMHATQKAFEHAKNNISRLRGMAGMPDWISRNKTGTQVGGAAQALHHELSTGYETFKNDIRNAGIIADTKRAITKNVELNIINPFTKEPITKTITTMEAPSLGEIEAQLKGVNAKAIESVHKAFESGDVGDLINAESDLGTFKANQWSDYFNKTNPLDRNALHYATKMENKINKIIEGMANKLDPARAKELLGLRERWRTELRPFLNIDPINRFVNGKLTAADLTRRLQANTKEAELFRATIAKDFKDVSRNKLKNELIKMGVDTLKLPAILKVLGK